jgi:hypothetical protein
MRYAVVIEKGERNCTAYVPRAVSAKPARMRRLHYGAQRRLPQVRHVRRHGGGCTEGKASVQPRSVTAGYWLCGQLPGGMAGLVPVGSGPRPTSLKLVAYCVPPPKEWITGFANPTEPVPAFSARSLARAVKAAQRGAAMLVPVVKARAPVPF